jgi:hypothetical protein
MTSEKPNPARGEAAGSGKVALFSGEPLPDKAAAKTNQAKILRLVRPPRPRRIEVTITARAGPRPVGRSRAFHIRESDIDVLIDVLVAHAERLEGLRS